MLTPLEPKIELAEEPDEVGARGGRSKRSGSDVLLVVGDVKVSSNLDGILDELRCVS